MPSGGVVWYLNRLINQIQRIVAINLNMLVGSDKYDKKLSF